MVIYNTLAGQSLYNVDSNKALVNETLIAFVRVCLYELASKREFATPREKHIMLRWLPLKDRCIVVVKPIEKGKLKLLPVSKKMHVAQASELSKTSAEKVIVTVDAAMVGKVIVEPDKGSSKVTTIDEPNFLAPFWYMLPTDVAANMVLVKESHKGVEVTIAVNKKDLKEGDVLTIAK